MGQLLLNQAYESLYGLIVRTNENYFINSADTTLISGTQTYTLPTDFKKLVGMDLASTPGASPVSLTPFNFQERNLYTQANLFTASGQQTTYKYNLQGSNFKLTPTVTGGGVITVWYIPLTPNIPTTVTEVQTWDCDNYLIAYLAYKMIAKGENDVSAIVGEVELARQEVIRSVRERDDGRPSRLIDLDTIDNAWIW
jgi:hypothetical protein